MQSLLLSEFFERDLKSLKEEILLYKNERDLWKIEKEIKNSAGNLSLHIVGNLNHFIGAILGNSGYIRQRDKEFSDKNIPVSKILEDIDKVILTLKNTLSNLSDTDLQKKYPIEFIGKQVSAVFVVTQLLIHLSYHLGQINYHRRLIN